MKNFTSEKIKSLRLDMRKSQTQIAEMLGIKTPSVSKIENGITDINLSRLKQISQLFGVATVSLIEDDHIEKERDIQVIALMKEVEFLKNENLNLHRKLIHFLQK